MEQNKSFCFLTNMTFFLQSRNIIISENLLGILLEMYGFYYSRIETSYEQLNGRNCTMEELFDRFERYMKEGIISYQVSKDKQLSQINKVLEEYQVAIVWIDDYFDSASLNYKKYHVMRPVVVKEIRENEIDIYDIYLKTISKELFYELLCGEVFNLFVLKKEYIFCLDENKEIKNGLINTARMYLGDIEGQGKKAFQMFIADFNDTQDCEQIYRYYIQIIRNGGCANIREYMKNFFEQYGEYIFGMNECQRFVDACSESYNQWHLIGNLMFLLSKNGDTNLRQRIVKRMELLYMKECEMFKVLLSLF